MILKGVAVGLLREMKETRCQPCVPSLGGGEHSLTDHETDFGLGE